MCPAVFINHAEKNTSFFMVEFFLSTDVSIGPGRWAILLVDRWSEKKRLA